MFRYCLTALALAALLASSLFLPPSSAQQNDGRGIAAEIKLKTESGQEVKLYDKSYALLIGASDYTHGWPKLPGVKRDIDAVRVALEKHGFQTVIVLNPNSAQLEEAYRNFIQQYGWNEENRLLFYFAGHGHTIKQSYGEEMGYIVPVDAPNPNRDKAGFVAKAMDMQQMELYARRIQAKHALFLFDSCFSGSLFSLSRAVPENITYKTSRPVRQFITSGSADEFVPDQSVFRQQFIAALEGEADSNRDGYVTGSELGDFLQDRVVNYTRNAQHPQYGKIRNPNLDKGDFVFALPKAQSPPVPPAIATKNNPTLTQPTLPAPSRVDPAQQELAFWNSIQNSADVEDFKDYLERYPNGLYAGIARRKVAALSSPAKSVPATPAGGGANSNPTGGARPSSPKPVVTNRAGVELVWVPPGSFMMGSNNGSDDEKPVHQLTIREGFYLGRYEVTQGQWQAVMGNNPSKFKGENLPVERVSWIDVQNFIQKLNAQNDGFIYRLPSEAEWEYACRAGTTGDYTGNLDTMAWYGNNSGRQYLDAAEILRTDSSNYFKRITDNGGQTHPVGQKQPNAFGLYDMHGNVWEWCQDYWHDNYNGAPTDGSAWLSGGDSSRRVLRGGAWNDCANTLRSAYRYGNPPVSRFNRFGFRLAAVAR